MDVDYTWPSGTVTFLFTDIAGSTRLWEQYPAAMRVSLALHDTVLRTAINSHAGVVVKGTGDGLLAAFAQADHALQAALAGQRALRDAPWEAPGRLHVRMALHSGTVTPQNGDYFGPTLNRSARLLAIGHGDQILVSQACAELLNGLLPEQVTLRNLGRHQLKDIPQPEGVFQVVAADLPADFPPLRSLNQRFNNVPPLQTTLIGREQVLQRLRDSFRTTRLLTMIGPGGTGKTSLALQSAHELSDNFVDGVCFVDLTAIRDPGLVIPSVGHALNLVEEPDRSISAAVHTYLRDRELLLILDNCEQVVDAGPDVAALLAAARKLHILATSREALNLSQEQVFPVPPLENPASNDNSLDAPATQLFLVRARAVRGDSTSFLSGEAAAAIAEICRRLDGLPLAIELAAARTRHLPPHVILERLNRPLELLRGGARNLPARQQALRATIGWSYDLLSAEEQGLFRRLSVFIGGWQLDAAEAAGGMGEETLDLLSSLIDKSLVLQIGNASDSFRYALFAIIREYAYEQLCANNEEATTMTAFTRYYSDLAAQAEPHLTGAQQAYWLEQLDQEHANLRATMDWLLSRQPDHALKTAGTLWRFWYTRGYLSEGRQRLEQAIQAAQGPQPAILAKALSGAGGIAWAQGDYSAAAGYQQQALDLYRQCDDQGGIARSLNILGVIYHAQHQYAEAQSHFQECLAVFDSLHDDWGRANALSNIGMALRHQEKYDASRQYLEQSLELRRRLADQRGIATSLLNLGELAVLTADAPTARRYLKESLDISFRLDDLEGVILVIEQMARLLVTQAQVLEAAQLWGAASVARERINTPLPPVEQSEFAQAVAATRLQVDAAAFDQAWNEGTQWSIEQAAALVTGNKEC